LGTTGKAVTAGATAVFGDGDQAGGEDGTGRGQLLEAGVEHAADEGGVLGNAHRAARPRESESAWAVRISKQMYPKMRQKQEVRRNGKRCDKAAPHQYLR